MRAATRDMPLIFLFRHWRKYYSEWLQKHRGSNKFQTAAEKRTKNGQPLTFCSLSLSLFLRLSVRFLFARFAFKPWLQTQSIGTTRFAFSLAKNSYRTKDTKDSNPVERTLASIKPGDFSSSILRPAFSPLASLAKELLGTDSRKKYKNNSLYRVSASVDSLAKSWNSLRVNSPSWIDTCLEKRGTNWRESRKNMKVRAARRREFVREKGIFKEIIWNQSRNEQNSSFHSQRHLVNLHKKSWNCCQLFQPHLCAVFFFLSLGRWIRYKTRICSREKSIQGNYMKPV